VVRQQNHIELNPFRPVKLPTSPRSLAASTAAAAAVGLLKPVNASQWTEIFPDHGYGPA